MTHPTTPDFWKHYERLPQHVQKLADKNFELLNENPYHPSLHFKRIGPFWTARVGISYRAVALEEEDGLYGFWIGGHDAYDRLIG